MAAKFEVFPTLSLKTFTHFTLPLRTYQTNPLSLPSFSYILTNQNINNKRIPMDYRYSGVCWRLHLTSVLYWDLVPDKCTVNMCSYDNPATKSSGSPWVPIGSLHLSQPRKKSPQETSSWTRCARCRIPCRSRARKIALSGYVSWGGHQEKVKSLMGLMRWLKILWSARVPL